MPYTIDIAVTKSLVSCLLGLSCCW